ncbi:hypothetical protein Q9R29_08490 [Rothia sp. ARF10]|nr:hypothetical protein [Rothia sp. ARF10]
MTVSRQPGGLAQNLATSITAACGDPSTWSIKTDYGYRDSLALCVIDAIQSTGVRYGSVEAVVSRYRAHRGIDAETDGAPGLLATFTTLGGEEAWSERIGTDNRLYPRMTAPRKAVAIHAAAEMLTTVGVHTAEQFRSHATDPDLRRAWLALPSQKSAITWHYAHMLAGSDGVKPDRMIRRFTAANLGIPPGSLSDQDLIDLVEAAAVELGRSAVEVDHAIWMCASGRTRLTANTS